MKFSLKVDMTPLGKALQKTGKNTSKNLGKAVLGGAFVIEAHAKINIKQTFKQHTGFMSANFETKIDSSSRSSAKAYTAPLAIYARIQELGGVIRPTNGPFLVFTTEDGQVHFSRSVTLPARPYLRPAADEHSQEVFDTVAFILQQAIEGK